MAHFQPSRRLPSLPQRLARGVRRSTPLAVWLGAVVAVCWLGTSLPPAEALRALVESPVGTVSTPVDGRVQTLLVGLHDDVAAGAIVARLDDSDVRLRLSKASYELERLRADMELEQRDRTQQARDAAVEHELDSGAEQRRLASTVEAAELAALATRTQLEEARVRLQGVSVEAERRNSRRRASSGRPRWSASTPSAAHCNAASANSRPTWPSTRNASRRRSSACTTSSQRDCPAPRSTRRWRRCAGA